MKKETKRIKKFNRFQINLSKLEEVQILKYLAGDISSREAGKNMGISHQQVINLTAQICRQWFQAKKVGKISRVYG